MRFKTQRLSPCSSRIRSFRLCLSCFWGSRFLTTIFAKVLGGALIGSVYCFGFLFFVKMFLGAQILAATGISAVLGWRDARAWKAVALMTAVSAIPLAHTFFAAAGSNTAVGIRPLEIVRYSMEKLDWDGAVSSLTAVGFLESPDAWAVVAASSALWFAGFLGARLLGLPGLWRDLWLGSSSIRKTMAWFVAIGIPVALMFRIAPEEAVGISRMEAQNDVVWFAAASGTLLWFWTAAAVRRPLSVALVLIVAVPCTVQHFAYAASLEPDRISSGRVSAARTAGSGIVAQCRLGHEARPRETVARPVSGRETRRLRSVRGLRLHVRRSR